MLKIYFDDVLIDEDSYTALDNEYKLFTDSFKLGSVASNSFKLSVNKSMVSSHPNEVKIEDDNTTFYLITDSITEDNYVYNYTLVDKLMLFNFNYDASIIINTKKENEETCYLSDIWRDMCEQAGVEYDDAYTFLNDIEVNWYDNTIQARKYLSFIATLQGGYACILANGKQSFKPYKKASSKTIDIDECSDFILGEKKKVTRVVYDTGTTFWSFGDDTGTTLYLDTDNVFITNEETVENIYDLIVDFEFYLVKVPNAPMDSSVRAGDIITFTDGSNEYPTIAQYSMSFGGAWIGGYELKVNTDKQEETKIKGQKDSIKRIQSEIDRTNADLKIIAEQTGENSSQIVSLNQNYSEFKVEVEETYETINESESKKTELSSRIDGLNYNISGSGGINDRKNSSGQFGTTYHTAINVEAIKDTTLRSEYCFKHTNLSSSVTDKFRARKIKTLENGQYVDSDDYFLSWNIHNQLEFGKFKMTVKQYELDNVVQSDSITVNKNDRYEIKSMLINLMNDLIEITEENIGEELTYNQSSEPLEANLNETWHNTINDVIARYDGEEWINTDLNYSTDVIDGIIQPKGIVKCAECMCGGGSVYREWQSANGEFKGRNFQFNENGQTISDGEKTVNLDVEGLVGNNGYEDTFVLNPDRSYTKNSECQTWTDGNTISKKISGGTGWFHTGGN